MGKIRVIGRAEREYKPDQCCIDLIFQDIKRTSDAAAKTVNDQCEKFLEVLVEKCFDIEKIVISSDSVEQQSDRSNRNDDSKKEIYFKANREIHFNVPAEQNYVNNIKDIIESGFKNTSFLRSYKISNEGELQKHLIKEAVSNSKEQASYLAESMGQKIIGIDTANLSDRWDYFKIEENKKKDMDTPTFLRAKSKRPLSDKLQTETIKLTAEVNIVWIIESK